MDMVGLFSLITLWCGNPGLGNTVYTVSECRTQILSCLKKDEFAYKFNPQCFVKQKLK